MTYTIVGRCERTGQIGIGIATYSLAVGATCPWVAPGYGILSTQAFTNPDLGAAAVGMLRADIEPEDILQALVVSDSDFEYRQIGILNSNGETAVHSGPNIRGWAGHIQDRNLIAMGNGLAGRHVIEAMADSFIDSESDGLANRLLTSLEAGRDAGGQEPSPGNRLPERSAALLIYGQAPVALTDLRVDAHDDAVTELRRVSDLYSKYAPYYNQRHRDPGSLIAQEVWTQENIP